MTGGGSTHYGTPGGSAQREHARRRDGREQRTRKRFPRLGGVVLALSDKPQHERAWERGALGEELVAASLAERCHAGVVVLHDLRVPGTRANIDHVAVAPSGVWVVDAKRYTGKVEVHKPLLGSASLRIAGRDKTGLVKGLLEQVELVTRIVQDVRPAVPVRGAFCFVDSELPLLGTLSIERLLVLSRRGLAKRVNAGGNASADDVRAVVAAIGARLPSA